MLNKLSTLQAFRDECATIDRVLNNIDHAKTKQKLEGLKIELIRLVNLCDEYHLAENRNYVNNLMLDDLRQDLVSVRKQIQSILREFK